VSSITDALELCAALPSLTQSATVFHLPASLNAFKSSFSKARPHLPVAAKTTLRQNGKMTSQVKSLITNSSSRIMQKATAQ
jgi:hypothetical protein